jgi:hypothetical protein
VSYYYGHDYNYDAPPYLKEPHLALRDIEGDSIALSDLRGKSVRVEFGFMI